jgi:hypothetical protein
VAFRATIYSWNVHTLENQGCPSRALSGCQEDDSIILVRCTNRSKLVWFSNCSNFNSFSNLETKFGFSLSLYCPIGSKPHNNLFSETIYLSHEGHLNRLFRIIALVDTYGINPYVDLADLSKSKKHSMAIRGHSVGFAFHEYG